MIRELFCGALLVAAAGVSRADDMEDRRKVAVEIAQVMTKGKISNENIRGTLMQQAERSITQNGLSPEDATAYRAAVKEAATVIDDATFYSVFSQGYANRLSLQELKDLLAFYQSPTGQALLREQNEMQKEQNQALNQLCKEVMADAEAKFQKTKGAEATPKPAAGEKAPEEKKGE